MALDDTLLSIVRIPSLSPILNQETNSGHIPSLFRTRATGVCPLCRHLETPRLLHIANLVVGKSPIEEGSLNIDLMQVPVERGSKVH